MEQPESNDQKLQKLENSSTWYKIGTRHKSVNLNQPVDKSINKKTKGPNNKRWQDYKSSSEFILIFLLIKKKAFPNELIINRIFNSICFFPFSPIELPQIWIRVPIFASMDCIFCQQFDLQLGIKSKIKPSCLTHGFKKNEDVPNLVIRNIQCSKRCFLPFTNSKWTVSSGIINRAWTRPSQICLYKKSAQN